MKVISLILAFLPQFLCQSSQCICTTVPCPQIGENNIIMGNGGANITYFYEEHNNIPVVIKGEGYVYPSSLGNGSDTTSCTRKYARMLEDDGADSCDAGHILANHMGGYGNQPLNIFPQNSTINKGLYNQYEGKIYDCILNASYGFLTWDFYYETSQNTQPNKVIYTAKFENSICEPLYEEFTN
jgi:hypothetical protein